MSFLRSKIVLSMSGLFLIGIVTVIFIGLSSVKTTNGPIAAVVTATTAADASPTAADTPNPSATTAPAKGSVPTAIPTTVRSTPVPTSPLSSPTPRPTATATTAPTAGQAVDWRDVIGSVGASTFTLRNRGTVVAVNGQTIYSGTARSFSQLRAGMPVEVHGTIQSNGSLLATEVNATIDN